MRGHCTVLRHALQCIRCLPSCYDLHYVSCAIICWCWWIFQLIIVTQHTHSVGVRPQPTLSATTALLFSPKRTGSASPRTLTVPHALPVLEQQPVVHSLCVWLINDVTSRDWAKAWASHFKSVKTMAPKSSPASHTASPLIKNPPITDFLHVVHSSTAAAA